MSGPSREVPYRDTPRGVAGLLGSIALLIAGLVAAIRIAAMGYPAMPLVLGALGLAVLAFVLCLLSASRRTRWTIEPDAVLVEEWPEVRMTGRRRERRVPFAEIGALGSLQSVAMPSLTLTTRDGERFVLPAGVAPKSGRYIQPDQTALAYFTDLLRTTMTNAGYVVPPTTEEMGFWNRPTGLSLLGIAFLLSLAAAAAALWERWERGFLVLPHSGYHHHDPLIIVLVLPIIVGAMLHKCWRRRHAVQKARSENPLLPT